MENNIENAESIHESDNTELIGNKVMNRATQTIKGDNPFFIELRQKDKINYDKILCELQAQQRSTHIKSLKIRFKNYKQGSTSSSFSIFKMVHSAFKNDDQNEWDQSRFNNYDHLYNKWDNLKYLLSTLPTKAIKVLNQFTHKYELVLNQVLNYGCSSNKYKSQNVHDCVYHSPFVFRNDNYSYEVCQVEQ